MPIKAIKFKSHQDLLDFAKDIDRELKVTFPARTLNGEFTDAELKSAVGSFNAIVIEDVADEDAVKKPQ